jgi:hypothetical protein
VRAVPTLGAVDSFERLSPLGREDPGALLFGGELLVVGALVLGTVVGLDSLVADRTESRASMTSPSRSKNASIACSRPRPSQA